MLSDTTTVVLCLFPFPLIKALLVPDSETRVRVGEGHLILSLNRENATSTAAGATAMMNHRTTKAGTGHPKLERLEKTSITTSIPYASNKNPTSSTNTSLEAQRFKVRPFFISV
ncbi:hypothetical protein MY11210_009626 [Beauveria gryllotalpidicola]